MRSNQYIAAALHYVDLDMPFFAVDEHGEPANGTGDSKYSATLDLRNDGLIETFTFNGKTRWAATDGLKVYIQALKTIPIPKRTWTHPMLRS